SGGPGSGLYKSTDGGDTWREITRNPGLPQGLVGKISIGISGADSNRVYALVENENGGLYSSDDAGATWKLMNAGRNIRQRAFYYTHVFADPKQKDTVYMLNTSAFRSIDGGKTLSSIGSGTHGDHHDLWIDPDDSEHVMDANDGGGTVTYNVASPQRAWTRQDFPTAQMYHVIATKHVPYHVCGAQQDNSTLCGPSRKAGGIDVSDWEDAGGGESGYIAARADDPDIVFAGSYGGLLTRKDMRTGLERNVNPWPDNPMGHSAGDIKERFQWTFPIVTSPHDPNVLYAASQRLWRTTNEGESWTAISGDLTRADPRTLGPSGGPITRDQTSVEYYGTIFTVAESPVRRGVIWTGSDDGRVHLTQNGGTTWTDVTPKGIPEWMRMSMIEASPLAAGTAYLAGNRYQLDDFTPYLYRTTDFGRTWTRIDDGISRTEYTRVVRADPERRGLLYAGTERGVWVSWDDGASWQKLQLNLPPVPVHDLVVKEGDLVAATHGRSFWVLDDLSALRQMTAAAMAKPAHLFKPRDAYRIQWSGGFGGGGGGGTTGANPASGATVRYHLAQANQEVRLEFADARGRLIRAFTSRPDSATLADSLHRDTLRVQREDSLRRAGLTPDSIRKLQMRGDPGAAATPDVDFESLARTGPRPPRVPNRAGLNTFSWDLRYPDATRFENMIMWAGGTNGPVAPPGTYSVRLLVDGKRVDSASFTVRKDPRSKATLADLQEQFAFLTRIRDRTSDANDAVRAIRSVRAQVEARRAQVPTAERDQFLRHADPLLSTLRAVEEEIYQVRNQSSQDPLNYPIKLNNKIAALAGVVASTEARPTRQSYQVFEGLSAQLETQLAAMRSALATHLPPLNATLRAVGLTPIAAPTAPGSRAD
ncbi:MAG: WD40/YVTN/BNR-like repeat-containing protein, partial [Gemmatimonadaceae bacterium]